jgi:transcriptional regulator with XRE-family HTH domain
MSSNLGSLIRVYRIRKGLSQADLAAKIGVSQGAIGQWERGEFRPRGKHINGLQEILGLTAEAIEREAARDDGTGQIASGAPDEAVGSEESESKIPHLGEDPRKWAMAEESLERLRAAEHHTKSGEFEIALFSLLSHIDGDIRSHVSIAGPASRHWIVDCITHRSVVEVKHPRSYVHIESLIAQTCWRLAVLRALMGDEKKYVAVIRRPPLEPLPEHALPFYEKKLAALAIEADLVGISLVVADTPEQVAKAIEDLENSLGLGRSLD